jgi:UDP-glucuronate decarboxylase
LIEGMIRMMNTGDEVTGPINMGNPGEFTILQLANKVIEMTDSKSRIVFKPLPSDDPMQRKPDITLAKNLLGWQPTIALEDGLKETIAYFKATL